MSERAATEVWIDHRGKGMTYIRLGPKDNLATVNDPKHAEVVREALQRFVDGMAASANSTHKNSEEKA